MKTIIHQAQSRGQADHGWLKTYHTFSFADYYDSQRIHFGGLCVLNDDVISPSMGFNTHSHENMEIITIPLEGALEHRDSTGGHGMLMKNEIQVMSAGTGISHSEFNASQNELLALLQIWIFTRKQNIKPRYDQKLFLLEHRYNHLQLVASPDALEDSLLINQDAWLYLGNFDQHQRIEYTLHSNKNGVYIFLIMGEIMLGKRQFYPRDGIGLSELNALSIETKSPCDILLMEVPMSF